MKRVLWLTLTLILVFMRFPNVSAEEIASQKDEVVYGILNLNGSVENIYVVNIFEDDNIIDYGNYKDIRNMTTSEKINREGDKISINTSADRLYYEGTVEKKELPWNIDIEYILNGKKIPGDELAGGSGFLEIKILVNRNAEIDSIFFENYALQIALTLNTKSASNIKTDSAIVADVCSKKHSTVCSR